ncbi:MAG: winged helix-turn-helix transcriptional regulator [Ruminiclostridium sp.]|nr:winged helix-turn-helix transcriptional regulator [Ruminiclostridium sp.]
MSELEFGSTLYKLYHIAVRLEESELKDNKSCAGLTVNELNLIECIRNLTKNGEGPTISSIATELDITRPSTTVAVNKLCSKEIAEKSESATDGRSVKVRLTPKGEKAYSAHHAFQSSLAKAAKQEMSEKDYADIAASLTNLNKFFTSRLEGI